MGKGSARNGNGIGTQAMFHLMMLPGMVFVAVFCYVPMVGIIMAFQDFVPAKGLLGSEFVGLEHFQYMFQLPDIGQVFTNTLVIAVGKIVLGTLMAIAFAILLNEIRVKFLKKAVQTIVYLPHFLSWKEFGYNSIVYLAAITAIDPGLHEAAAIDGATWRQRVWHITLPGMLPIILLMAAMSLTSILSAGFDQIYNLYSPMVYETGDVLDTYVYRMGLIGRQYSFSTAVGLLRSVVGLILMVTANELSKRFTERKIF